MTAKICLDEEDIAEILAEYYGISRDKIQMIWREKEIGWELRAEIETPISGF